MGIVALLLFGVYLLCMYWYIFHSGGGTVPKVFQGTVADPVMFMSEKELFLSGEYSKIRNFLFFIATPLEWLVYAFILLTGISRYFEKVATAQTKWKLLRNAGYLFLLSLLLYLVLFPLDYYRYYLSKSYGISTQAFSSWMRDGIIDFWVNFGTSLIVVSVIYWLIKKSEKRWWLYTWLLTIPFTIFVMFIQPVVIDPLYNDFYPLKDKNLEKKIITLAKEANIPAHRVYEVNMSTKTTTYNAYVTGIGKNARIVLWDTTLKGLTEDEIMFIMAHEMSHYVHKDIYKSMFGMLAGSLVGLFIIHLLLKYVLSKSRSSHSTDKMAVILTIFLIISGIVGFISDPISNAFSRSAEKRADLYAVKLTHDPEAGIIAFQKLSKNSLSQVNPPFLVKLFRYDHPTMLERMRYLEAAEKRINSK